jgi:hypothetical protein
MKYEGRRQGKKERKDVLAYPVGYMKEVIERSVMLLFGNDILLHYNNNIILK